MLSSALTNAVLRPKSIPTNQCYQVLYQKAVLRTKSVTQIIVINFFNKTLFFGQSQYHKSMLASALTKRYYLAKNNTNKSMLSSA